MMYQLLAVALIFIALLLAPAVNAVEHGHNPLAPATVTFVPHQER